MKYIRLFEAGDRVVVLEYGEDTPVIHTGVVEDAFHHEFMVRLDQDPDTLYPFTLYADGVVQYRPGPLYKTKWKLMFAE